MKGLQHIGFTQGVRVVHGSTVATNAILERKGAKTALITNEGFEDILEIGRQNRQDLYALDYRKPTSLIPRKWRFGVESRICADGCEETPFNDEQARKVLKSLKEQGVESAAVCFLFSFLNNAHETQMKELFDESGIMLSVSSELLAEFREYERMSTTVINAYVAPKMKSYLGQIQDALDEKSLAVMQSNGGRITAQTAMQEPVRTIYSGPAGGVVGAWTIGKQAGYDPRDFTLFSFGGAGGLHAVFLARMLGIPRVMIPKNPGLLSAMGMLLADVVKDYSQTVMLDAGTTTAEDEGTP